MDVKAQLEEIVRRTNAESGREPRAVYTRVASDARGHRIESSDAKLLQRLLSRSRETLPQADVRAVELPVPTLRAQCAWVTASVADVRRDPSHAAEQVTQALQGEVLEPLLHEEGWLLARLPDGYVGWLRDWHLRLHAPTVPARFAQAVNARIQVATARLRETPGTTTPARAESVLGTRVVAGARKSDWLEIEIPGGTRGWAHASEVRAGAADWPMSREAILSTLHTLIGVPYVWGGRSPKGFDCSGLVQFVFGLHGVPLPRDSDQQFECGQVVQEPVPGDLLFFGRDSISHVAVALGAREYLHARGHVRRNSLATGAPAYDAELAGMLRGTRRILPHSDAPPGSM
ncbi:MAG: C40 family peptidase [Candidatus Latescibacterota bacterium]|nr:MAG: C40 family peptidase [Candidatus Latescibacterota bacterium]